MAGTRLLRQIGSPAGLFFLLALAFVSARVATPTHVQAQGLPSTCAPNVIFNIAGSQALGATPVADNTGELYELNTTNFTNTPIGNIIPSGSTRVPVNGLAVTSPVPDHAYAVRQTPTNPGAPGVNVPQQIYTFTNGTATVSDNAPATGLTLVMGGVDPANGDYYYAGYSGTGTSRVIEVYGYNPTTSTPLGLIVRVTGIPGGNSSGDLAFDSNGNLFIVTGTQTASGNTSEIIVVEGGPLPTTGPEDRTYEVVRTLGPSETGAFYNGIAWGPNGTLYAQYADTNGPATLDAISPEQGGPVSSHEQFGVPGQGGNPGTGTILTDLAGCATPGTLTVRKDLPNGPAASGDRFTMSVVDEATGHRIIDDVATTGTCVPPETPATLQCPILGPAPTIPETVYRITERVNQATTTSPSSYSQTLTCVNTSAGNAPVPATPVTGSPGSWTITFPPLANAVAGSNVVCTFSNTPVQPTLTLRKELGGTGRFNPGDQFTVAIHQGTPGGPPVGTGNPTTAGTGTTVTTGTGTLTVSPASAGVPYYLSETLVPGAPPPTSTLALSYRSIIQCTDLNHVQTTGLPNQVFDFSAASIPVTPVPGSDLDCVITNTPVDETVLGLNKNFATDRVRDTDQFTVATNPPLGPQPNHNPTTVGTGSTVEPLTGTIGFPQADLLQQYFLTETAAGTTNPALYTATVFCEDLSTGTVLVDNVPITDHPSVTPTTAGQEISCTITNRAVPPTLQLDKQLGGDRVNPDDQFTMRIESPVGTVVGTTGTATTDGTGSTVDNGTGVTRLDPAEAGTNYYLNEAPSGTTNLLQYTSTISCTDTNGVQAAADLPSGPFQPPHPIIPDLGAAIECTATNTPAAPGLELNKELGNARIADTDQFTLQIQNPPGTVVGTTDHATTIGTGDAVTPETGTTVLSPAEAGTAYTLTEVAAGTTNLAHYTTTITCTDLAQVQTDLPDAEPFTGSTTITPVAGAELVCTIQNTARPQVSLSVTKSVSPNPYTAGQPLTYTITVTNGGPDTANPATVDDPLPPQLSGAVFTWTCTATGAGTSCGAATGTAPPLHDTPVIPAGGTVTYTLTGTVPQGTTGTLHNTVTVTPPPDAVDPGCTPNCTASADTQPIKPPVAPGLPNTGAQP